MRICVLAYKTTWSAQEKAETIGLGTINNQHQTLGSLQESLQRLSSEAIQLPQWVI